VDLVASHLTVTVKRKIFLRNFDGVRYKRGVNIDMIHSLDYFPSACDNLVLILTVIDLAPF